MSFVFDHFNYHVTDMDRSVAFYEKTLRMKVIREMGSSDGPVRFVMLGYDDQKVVLELKKHWLYMRRWASSYSGWVTTCASLKIPTAIKSRS